MAASQRKKSGKQDPIYYVDNKVLYEAMKVYKAACDEAKQKDLDFPRVPRYIGECIVKIANKLSTDKSFINYSYRHEMVEDGIENCLRYIRSFNTDKYDHPFNYFTTIAYNSFRHRIGREQKEQYTKYKLLEQMVLSGTMSEANISDLSSQNSFWEKVQTFIADYEAKLKEKKNKKSKKKTAGLGELIDSSERDE